MPVITVIVASIYTVLSIYVYSYVLIFVREEMLHYCTQYMGSDTDRPGSPLPSGSRAPGWGVCIKTCLHTHGFVSGLTYLYMAVL